MKPESKGVWTVISFLLVPIISATLLFSACNLAGFSKPPADQPSGNTTVPATPTIPAVPPISMPQVPTIPVTPPVTTPPETPQTPAAPVVTEQPPAPSPDIVYKKEACLMALTKEDMGEGWTRASIGSVTILYTNSTCHVYYTQGGSFSPAVQNTVAVYRTIDVAKNAFEKEKPQDVILSYPNIGNECFLNDSAPINKLLVFRKGNVVAWVWLQQDKTGDILKYAKIVDQKITP